MSSTTFSYEFNYEAFKGKVNFPTGVFIDGQFSAGSNGTTIEYVVMLYMTYLCFTVLIHTCSIVNPCESTLLQCGISNVLTSPFSDWKGVHRHRRGNSQGRRPCRYCC